MWKGLIPFMVKMLIAFAMIGVFVVFRIAAMRSDRRAMKRYRARVRPPQNPAAAS
jgi:hypothetical protein